uniref:Uncharacterized protein n=1 Tax=Arundo donax TaxID=35708 RepID=A0A0A8Z8E0_ARUDO
MTRMIRVRFLIRR